MHDAIEQYVQTRHVCDECDDDTIIHKCRTLTACRYLQWHVINDILQSQKALSGVLLILLLVHQPLSQGHTTTHVVIDFALETGTLLTSAISTEGCVDILKDCRL